MTTKRKAAGVTTRAASYNVQRSNILTFPMTTATCVDCGTSFRRKHDETWKLRCVQCWTYLTHYRAIVAFERM